MPGDVQRGSTIAVGVAVVGLVGWLTWAQLDKPRPRANPADAGVAAVEPEDLSDGGLEIADAGAAPDDGGLSLLPMFTDAGALPSGAPRTVHLGVVLVQYVGAEGAPASARSKAEALRHAAEVSAQARADFKAAVKAGDLGSAEDIGRLPRGVLDARSEVAVFSLTPGEISEPIDTARGFWVVKRID